MEAAIALSWILFIIGFVLMFLPEEASNARSKILSLLCIGVAFGISSLCLILRQKYWLGAGFAVPASSFVYTAAKMYLAGKG